MVVGKEPANIEMKLIPASLMLERATRPRGWRCSIRST